MRDAVVVGAGLAGLVAALRLARAGASVTLVSSGQGGLQLGQGTLDVLGYRPRRVTAPYAELDEYASANPGHPYALLGADAVRRAIAFVTDAAGGVLAPGNGTNLQLPTAVGAIRPTAVAPASMLAADLGAGSDRRFVVVGLRRLKDFWPELVAANLDRTVPPTGTLAARADWIDLEVRPGEQDTAPQVFARALDDPVTRGRLAGALAGIAREGETLLLPAVLGLTDADAHADLERRTGHPIAEIPLPPPGIPGLRLAGALTAACRVAGVRLVPGSAVIGADTDGDRLRHLVVATTGRPTPFAARSFVFAPGGFESGALVVDSHGRISEPTLDLPVTATDARALVGPDATEGGDALFRVGVPTDAALRPVHTDGSPVHPNLRIAGGLLAGACRWREKSGEGIAAASALAAAESILEELS